MRVYSTVEIMAACEVLKTLSDGSTITVGDGQQEEATELLINASMTALRIIRTGLAEMAAEHLRLSQPPQ